MSRPDSRNRSRGQLEALYNISRALNSTLNVDTILQDMLFMALEIFDAGAGSVMVENDGYLTIEVSQGLDPEIVAKTRQRVGTGIAGWVFEQGQPLQLDGKVDDPRFSRLIDRKEDICSSLCVPIRKEGRPVGVVMIRRAGEKAFEEGDLSFLITVAELAAVALSNAQVYEREKHQRSLVQLEHQKMRATLASMADGVVVVDKAGKVLTTNKVAEELLRPLVGDQLNRLWEKHPQIFQPGPGGVPLESGDRQLAVVPTPLVVDGREEGSVLLFRDETTRREVERMKSEFLSMVSHELKTPITTIGAFVELLLAREFPLERRRHFLSICQDESHRLQSLIEQLLQLTRLEAGGFALQRKWQPLGELVRKCLPAFQETNPKHRFLLEVDDEDTTIPIDPMLVTQAITNLFSNASKYSPDGGAIEVAVAHGEKFVTLSVRDQGVGIESEKLPLIFEKFYRIDNSLTRTTGGTGLGLANVKHIAQAHGGRAWAESQPGQGSTFYLTLPRESGEETDAAG